MSRIIGTARTSFKGQDGTLVEGTTIYVADPIDPSRGEGESAERYFLSKAKLTGLGFPVAVGQEVELLFNKFGKIASMKLLDDALDID